jgi:hypothetical protein
MATITITITIIAPIVSISIIIASILKVVGRIDAEVVKLKLVG